jgi:hypothetical protein
VPAVRAHGGRSLVYGMQSSGATLVALLLAQEPEAVACLDVACGRLAPPAAAYPTDRASVVKVTVSTDQTLDQQRARVAPDRTVLVLRHPCHVYSSLVRKKYATTGGTPDDKLRRLEARDRGGFDVVVRYEDLVFRPALVQAQLAASGVPLPADAAAFARSRQDVMDATRAIPALDATFMHVWDKGNVDPRGIDRTKVFKRVSPSVRAHVARVAPELTAEFDAWYADQYARWRVVAGGWWGDTVEPRVRSWARRSRAKARQVVQSPGE